MNVQTQRNKLDSKMMRSVWKAARDADAILAIVDSSAKPKEALESLNQILFEAKEARMLPIALVSGLVVCRKGLCSCHLKPYRLMTRVTLPCFPISGAVIGRVMVEFLRIVEQSPHSSFTTPSLQSLCCMGQKKVSNTGFNGPATSQDVLQSDACRIFRLCDTRCHRCSHSFLAEQPQRPCLSGRF